MMSKDILLLSIPIVQRFQALYFTHFPRSPNVWICTKCDLGGPLGDIINRAEF